MSKKTKVTKCPYSKNGRYKVVGNERICFGYDIINKLTEDKDFMIKNMADIYMATKQAGSGSGVKGAYDARSETGGRYEKLKTLDSVVDEWGNKHHSTRKDLVNSLRTFIKENAPKESNSKPGMCGADIYEISGRNAYRKELFEAMGIRESAV